MSQHPVERESEVQVRTLELLQLSVEDISQVATRCGGAKRQWVYYVTLIYGRYIICLAPNLTHREYAAAPSAEPQFLAVDLPVVVSRYFCSDPHCCVRLVHAAGGRAYGSGCMRLATRAKMSDMDLNNTLYEQAREAPAERRGVLTWSSRSS